MRFGLNFKYTKEHFWHCAGGVLGRRNIKKTLGEKVLTDAADSVAGRAGAGAGATQGRALGRGVAGPVPAARSRVAGLILHEKGNKEFENMFSLKFISHKYGAYRELDHLEDGED